MVVMVMSECNDAFELKVVKSGQITQKKLELVYLFMSFLPFRNPFQPSSDQSSVAFARRYRNASQPHNPLLFSQETGLEVWRGLKKAKKRNDLTKILLRSAPKMISSQRQINHPALTAKATLARCQRNARRLADNDARRHASGCSCGPKTPA